MASRDELVETVAQSIGRTRIDVPIRDYHFEDARRQNASGWPVEPVAHHVVLSDDELADAWTRSESMMRAWA